MLKTPVDLLSGLVAYDDDSHSDDEDIRFPLASKGGPPKVTSLDVRAFIANVDRLRFPPARCSLPSWLGFFVQAG